MAQQSSFFNSELVNGKPDRTYSATDWANYFATFLANGVSPLPQGGLSVDAGSGLDVIVNIGTAFINGYRYANTSQLNLTLNEPSGAYPRITNIVIELNISNRTISAQMVDGTPAPTPTAPNVIQTEAIYQICLAQITVGAGLTQISQNDITDTRADNTICGFVHGLFGENEMGLQDQVNNLNATTKENTNNLSALTQTLANDYTKTNELMPITYWNGTIADFNQMTTTGYYLVNADWNTGQSLNAPPTTLAGYLQVIENSSFCYQTYVTYSNSIYVRSYYAWKHQWSAWEQVFTENSGPTLTSTWSMVGNNSFAFLNASSGNNTAVMVSGDVFEVCNAITWTPLMSYTPVTSGLDTVTLGANYNFPTANQFQINGVAPIQGQVVSSSINYSSGETLNYSFTYTALMSEGLTGQAGAIGMLTIELTPTFQQWFSSFTVSLNGLENLYNCSTYSLNNNSGLECNFNPTAQSVTVTTVGGGATLEINPNQTITSTYLIYS